MINAVGHLSIGMGNCLSTDDLKMRTFLDQDNKSVTSLSDYPYIILTAKNNNKLNQLHTILKNQDRIKYMVFYDTMITDDISIQEQKVSSGEDLQYVAISLFGDEDEVSLLTTKFSLFL